MQSGQPSKGFVVYSRNQPRSYMDGTGAWWRDVDKGKLFPTARLAEIEVNKNRKIAGGYEPYETAAARK
jgi:hypothetical protein